MRKQWEQIGLFTVAGALIGFAGCLLFVGGPVEWSFAVAAVTAALFGLAAVLIELFDLRNGRHPSDPE